LDSKDPIGDADHIILKHSGSTEASDKYILSPETPTSEKAKNDRFEDTTEIQSPTSEEAATPIEVPTQEQGNLIDILDKDLLSGEVVQERVEQELFNLTPEQKQWAADATITFKKISEIHDDPFDGFEKIYQEKKQPHGLIVHFKSYQTPSNNRVNITRCEWHVPCTPEQFIKFQDNSVEQYNIEKNICTEIATTIDQFAKTPEQCFSVYYVGYRKVAITSARDLVYLKLHKKIEENKWADGATSIIHKDCPEVKDKIRGEMILSGHIAIRDDDPVTGKVRSRVRLYSETDLKANVPAFLAKPFCSSTIKQYIEKCIARIQELHPQ